MSLPALCGVGISCVVALKMSRALTGRERQMEVVFDTFKPLIC